ncbi:methyltransferase domain-containing protein [Streptomyces sp. NPDC001889]
MTLTSEQARARLTGDLRHAEALSTPPWVEAFASVPREVFVPAFQIRTDQGLASVDETSPDFYERVYSDTSLITRWDTGGSAISSSSQPSLMARMLEAFTAGAGPVLEIGTGTGYNTALLCHRFGAQAVVSMDIDPILTRTARERLWTLDYKPTIVTGDGRDACGLRAPYGGILATCGVHRVPAEWVRQVRPGGVIVTNVLGGIAHLTVTPEGTATGRFLPEPAAFMIARSSARSRTPRVADHSGHLLNGAGQHSAEVDLPVAAHQMDAFYDALMTGPVPEVALYQDDVQTVEFAEPDADRLVAYCMRHPDTGSWARIVPLRPGRAQVTIAGPRDLYAERAPLTVRWLRSGSPGPDHYRLTVTDDGTHTLYREGPAPGRWTT